MVSICRAYTSVLHCYATKIEIVAATSIHSHQIARNSKQTRLQFIHRFSVEIKLFKCCFLLLFFFVAIFVFLFFLCTQENSAEALSGKRTKQTKFRNCHQKNQTSILSLSTPTFAPVVSICYCRMRHSTLDRVYFCKAAKQENKQRLIIIIVALAWVAAAMPFLFLVVWICTPVVAVYTDVARWSIEYKCIIALGFRKRQRTASLPIVIVMAHARRLNAHSYSRLPFDQNRAGGNRYPI